LRLHPYNVKVIEVVMARAIHAILFGWFLMAAGGCIIPVPHGSTRTHHSRRLISEDEFTFIQPNITRREELILKLGEPDISLKDDRVLAWHWTSAEWTVLLVVGGGYSSGGAAVDVPDNHYLLTAFDEHGVLIRSNRLDDQPFKPVPFTVINDY
jgi:hypothetical protein